MKKHPSKNTRSYKKNISTSHQVLSFPKDSDRKPQQTDR